MRIHFSSVAQLLCGPLLLLTLSGCGVLLGNVKPVTEKSEGYRVIDLSESNDDWVKLDSQATEGLEDYSEVSTYSTDSAYQSKETASIISLNSACREKFQNPNQDLKSFTQQLLLGISDVKAQQEKVLVLEGVDALETTIEGKMGSERVKIRTVVLKKNDCLFDLMYVARPDQFDAQVEDFSRFVSSLRVR